LAQEAPHKAAMLEQLRQGFLLSKETSFHRCPLNVPQKMPKLFVHMKIPFNSQTMEAADLTWWSFPIVWRYPFASLFVFFQVINPPPVMG